MQLTVSLARIVMCQTKPDYQECGLAGIDHRVAYDPHALEALLCHEPPGRGARGYRLESAASLPAPANAILGLRARGGVA
jgi:hypothetical protein